jgi:two-component system chemotaxis response regulator CheY
MVMEINKNMNVLIVDDHKSMLRIIRNLLGQIGMNNVDEAKDGNEALEKLSGKKYDLVLSDWNMAPMSGLELLRNVRSNDIYQHKNVPFIMITAESKPENVIEAKKCGVDNYIIKPFNAGTLDNKIKAVFMKKAA